MNRPVVLVDLDNTIANLDGKLAETFAKRHPDVVYPVDRKHFEHDSKIDALARQIMNEDGFFASLEPMKNAVEAIKALDEVCEIQFCTSALSNTVYGKHPCPSDKFKWIEQHFGNDAKGRPYTRRLTITKDKFRVQARFLIDDIDQRHHGSETWEQIWFTQPWNRHEPGPRIRAWNEAVPLLQRLLLTV